MRLSAIEELPEELRSDIETRVQELKEGGKIIRLITAQLKYFFFFNICEFIFAVLTIALKVPFFFRPGIRLSSCSQVKAIFDLTDYR